MICTRKGPTELFLLLYPGVGPTKGVQSTLADSDVFPSVAEQQYP